MATGSPLSIRLGRIRRRLRLLTALEGAVAGAAIGALAAAAGLALARLRGAPPISMGVAAPILLGLLVGAAVRGTRRISLLRCARIADAALDGQDRLLSALVLEELPATPFSRAIVADALRRAEVLVPRAVVPARRPAGLPALGVAALAIAGAALVPTASRAARAIPATAPIDRAVPLAAGALDAERAAARAAAAQAARLGDERLAALAAELDGALRRLSAGALGDGAALDLLADLAARAAAASRAARQDRQAAQAAATALESDAGTRAAGEALAHNGEGDAERAREALGASAASSPSDTGRALAAAAASLSTGAGGTEDGSADANAAGRRRLAREDQRASAPGGGDAHPSGDAAEQRHLERLRRDLDDAASACHDGDPSCRARAEQRARDLSQLGRQGAAADGLERLARAARQLRERIGRGELRDGDGQALRGFGRAAAGAPGTSDGNGRATGNGPADESGSPTAGGEPEDGTGGDGQGASGDDAPSAPGEGATTSPSTLFGVEGGGSPAGDQGGTGNGIGHQPGGAPLGGRADGAEAARGTKADVPLADGAGPSRAEVIGTAAGRGFASPGYARAFADYAAAVEDALDTTAVPEGKRYLVRRYFDLIRPRAPARAPWSRP